MAQAPRLSVVSDPSRPRKLGRYELEERLGGEDGVETFRARVRGLAGFDRIFAVKCLRRPRGSQVNLNDPFIKTARRLASINDPRVGRVLDADVVDGVAVAVTEFVHGLDLDRFRECAQFSGVLSTGNDETGAKWQKIVAYIGAEVAGGLTVIHGLTPPLAHAGLCPRNIVATAGGGIKVLDAGLAQAAGQVTAPPPKRSLAYVGADATHAEPSVKGDMRALGAILFELATGELPVWDAASEMARKVLDSLWPSMADFVAGLLSDDPALRPTASEAAKTLAEHWADIPDVSMVSEMAALVRNFSAFVADAGAQNTAPPIVQESRQEPSPPSAVPAEVFSIVSPPPGASLATSTEPAASVQRERPSDFDDVPTVVRESGSYAAALFQSAETDTPSPDSDEPLLLDDSSRPLLPQLRQPAGNATLLAYPTPPPPPRTSLQPLQPLAIQLEADPAASSEPIPELAEWGAQALAALGDQAGVTVARLVTPPAFAQDAVLSEPPPPVNDPAIEEAFAFMPPPPPADEPMLVGAAQVEAEDRLPPGPPPPPPAPNSLLEDELVDDASEAVSGAGEAALSVSEDASLDPARTTPTEAEPADEARPLVATAFEDEVAAQGEWAAPRLAQAMEAPQEDHDRHAVARSAARSSADTALSEVDAEALANATRTKRITVGIAVLLLVGGTAAVALSALGVFPKQHGAISKVEAPAAVEASGTKAAPTSPVAKVEDKISPPARATAPTPPPVRVATSVPASAPATPVASARPGSAATVTMSVTSKPAGATVWIDGEDRGTTPCAVKLVSGRVHLTLVRAGHVSSTSTVETSDGKVVEQTLQAVDPPLTGEARFRAECKTAGKLPIVVDGRETGVFCPYSKLRLEPGTHRIGVLVPATGKVHEKEIALAAGVRSIVFGD